MSGIRRLKRSVIAAKRKAFGLAGGPNLVGTVWSKQPTPSKPRKVRKEAS